VLGKMVSEPAQYILNLVNKSPGINKKDLTHSLVNLATSMGSRASQKEIHEFIDEALKSQQIEVRTGKYFVTDLYEPKEALKVRGPFDF